MVGVGVEVPTHIRPWDGPPEIHPAHQVTEHISDVPIAVARWVIAVGRHARVQRLHRRPVDRDEDVAASQGHRRSAGTSAPTAALETRQTTGVQARREQFALCVVTAEYFVPLALRMGPGPAARATRVAVGLGDRELLAACTPP